VQLSHQLVIGADEVLAGHALSTPVQHHVLAGQAAQGAFSMPS
jgi:hypothetical protein